MELLQGTNESDADLQRDMMALAVSATRVIARGPGNGSAVAEHGDRLRDRDRHAHFQPWLSIGRSSDNGALTMSTPDSFYLTGDLLAGTFLHQVRYSISAAMSVSDYHGDVRQHVNDRFHRCGLLWTWRRADTTNEDLPWRTANADELRDLITRAQRHWVRGRVSGVAPVIGHAFRRQLRVVRVAIPDPRSCVLDAAALPGDGSERSRSPASAHSGTAFRDGSRPPPNCGTCSRKDICRFRLPMAGGLVLAHSPRAVRGGFSFIF